MSARLLAAVTGLALAVPFAGADAQAARLCSGCIPGIVEIQADVHFQGSSWWGTGIVLTASGEVLTNNHVIRGASSITVTDVDNGRRYHANVAGYDAAEDVAVLRLDGAAGLPTARLGNSALASRGDAVTAYGGSNGPGKPLVVAQGKVSNRTTSVVAFDPYTGATEPLRGLIGSDAPIRPGFSGGPLVNAYGNVIGIDTVGGFGRAGSIPIDRARAIATAVTAGRSSASIHVGPTPLLGMTVQPGGLYRGLTPGATVLGVIKGSAVARAGLSPGDIVQSFAGHAVGSPDDLTALLVAAKPGDTVQISWQTPAGLSRSATVHLTAGPPQ
jgi:S1-C subfamily serine protease